MSRSWRFALTITSLCILVAVALQAQGRQGGRGQVQLPDGAGKDTVTATCASCHGLNMITGSVGYTQEAWRDLVATMVQLPQPRRPQRCRSTSPRTFRRSLVARRCSCPAT